MKTAVLTLSLLYSVSVWAVPKAATCEMHSGENQTHMGMVVNGAQVNIKMGDGDPDRCALESHSNYDLHARCGSGEDAVYFGVKRSSGKVYADFGTIAQLKNCRVQN